MSRVPLASASQQPLPAGHSPWAVGPALEASQGGCPEPHTCLCTAPDTAQADRGLIQSGADPLPARASRVSPLCAMPAVLPAFLRVGAAQQPVLTSNREGGCQGLARGELAEASLEPLQALPCHWQGAAGSYWGGGWLGAVLAQENWVFLEKDDLLLWI